MNIPNTIDTIHKEYSAREFADFIEDFAFDLRDKFLNKNKQYAGADDIYSQIREQAVRAGDESVDGMLRVIFTLKDKHDVAFLRHLGEESDFEDRIGDIIIYSLLALYLYKHNEE